MSLRTDGNHLDDESAADVERLLPALQMTTVLGEWWTFHLDVTASAIAADVSKARSPFELWAMMPRIAASVATVLQRYARKSFEISEEIRIEVAAITAPQFQTRVVTTEGNVTVH